MNLELNVVRFNNEDVIATSCNADLTTLIYMNHITSDPYTNYPIGVVADVETFHFEGGVFVYDGKQDWVTTDFYTGNASDVKKGDWFHISDLGGDGVKCTDPNHHGATKQD